MLSIISESKNLRIFKNADLDLKGMQEVLNEELQMFAKIHDGKF